MLGMRYRTWNREYHKRSEMRVLGERRLSSGSCAYAVGIRISISQGVEAMTREPGFAD